MIRSKEEIMNKVIEFLKPYTETKHDLRINNKLHHNVLITITSILVNPMDYKLYCEFIADKEKDTDKETETCSATVHCTVLCRCPYPDSENNGTLSIAGRIREFPVHINLKGDMSISQQFIAVNVP